MSWDLKGGVIIIGSLLWQDYLHKKDDDIRRNWRENHLDVDNRIPVKLPIRYGRKSGKAGSEIMTMVFSNRMARKYGFGFIVPLKKRITSRDELLDEAVALSAAEGMEGDFIRPWGILTYLLNDSLVDANQKKEIVRVFKLRKNAEFDALDYRVGRERSCVTNSLKLNINWVTPILDGDRPKIEQLHFLLATATKPMEHLPSPKEIAETIKSDSNRKYFLNNLRNGIITREDFEISKLL
jgi:hypothetical protein